MREFLGMKENIGKRCKIKENEFGKGKKRKERKGGI